MLQHIRANDAIEAVVGEGKAAFLQVHHYVRCARYIDADVFTFHGAFESGTRASDIKNVAR